jgi:hypothetical protein
MKILEALDPMAWFALFGENIGQPIGAGNGA